MTIARTLTASALLLVSLAACSGDDESPATDGAPTTATTEGDTSGGGESETTDTDTADGGATDGEGGDGAPAGSEVTCGDWNEASREEKTAYGRAYLEDQGLDASDADAANVTVAIDTFCAGKGEETVVDGLTQPAM